MKAEADEEEKAKRVVRVGPRGDEALGQLWLARGQGFGWKALEPSALGSFSIQEEGVVLC